ncbi:hypothetical protein [Amycolatopsis sp. H20-H5]|uniref:hypothetical protein n=1 Tax=Amycolatopsis sp. H20-H5 TaxID=3046309 RepID=UPI002DC030F1|nr:hypothetical protein [Amycolatopsis sp. H20-H5]MEC3980358.1 hypothetical protein [Amycolatopsis sp. H20-H5]
MQHGTDEQGGRGLSTQDLLAAEPESERRDVEFGEARASEETEERVEREPVEQAPAASSAPADDSDGAPLFAVDDVERFRDDWQNIQIAFVDDPQRAVREADELVASVIQSLAATFAEHKTDLEAQWGQGEAATEDLRLALRQYRSFFNQLLSN